jgi:hypothetical protein
MKTCSKCKLPKEENEFSFVKKFQKLASQCKSCNNKARQVSRDREKAGLPTLSSIKPRLFGDLNTKSPEYVLALGLRTKYGITLEHYNQLFATQGGRCSICGIHQVELEQRLCVDHNHLTEQIRGLLCKECNFGLGKFKDDKKLLLKAVNYLESWR